MILPAPAHAAVLRTNSACQAFEDIFKK